MTDQLTIPGAVDELVVHLATLTVQGRRITRTLYQQLRDEPLIADDGTLNGRPWGYVNEHSKTRNCGHFSGLNAAGQWDGRAFDRGHRHIIWQCENELLRDVVLSLDAMERSMEWSGEQRKRILELLPPHTVPVLRRSLNLVAGLPQIFIGR